MAKWLSAADVQAECPGRVNICRVRALLKLSGLSHKNGKRIFLRVDRLEQFIDQAFAPKLIPYLNLKPKPKLQLRADRSTRSKTPPAVENAYTLACALARVA